LKKFLSIFLLSIYLISITELSQLIKLPLLIEHFSEHKQKDGHMSLWKFLHIHYSQNKLNDVDYEKDMKLPFKSHDGCINSIVSESVITSYYFLYAKPVFSHSNSYSSYTEQFLTSAYLTSIWQPPKSC
jgi:hypothetical protein